MDLKVAKNNVMLLTDLTRKADEIGNEIKKDVCSMWE